MTDWSIFYGDGSRADGVSRDDWRDAPASGVQVVTEWREPVHPLPDGRSERRFAGVADRVLHTGTDAYDPFGWGAKIGTLISDEAYEAIWREAAHGDR